MSHDLETESLTPVSDFNRHVNLVASRIVSASLGLVVSLLIFSALIGITGSLFQDKFGDTASMTIKVTFVLIVAVQSLSMVAADVGNDWPKWHGIRVVPWFISTTLIVFILITAWTFQH